MGSSVPMRAAATAIASQATAVNAHRGTSSRRKRSARTVRGGRRFIDLASRLPVTKNMAGMAATK